MAKSKRSNFWHRLRRPHADWRPPSAHDAPSKDMLATKILEKHRRRTIRRAQKYRSFFIRTNQHMVSMSLALLIVVAVFFGAFIYWRLYRMQDYSTFSYNVTQVVPVPVGRVGSSFIFYKDYLQDFRRQVYYFETQQQLDFDQPQADDQVTLAELKNSAMQRVIDRIYIKKLAQRYQLSVDAQEIDRHLELLQSQNKLGGDLDDIEDVLQSFWDLTLAEYRQIIADQLLQKKVVRHMDAQLNNNAYERTQAILRQLKSGEDFAEVAGIYSEDVITAVRGGEYNFLLDLEEQDEDPLVLQAIFETPVGQFSEIIDTGQRLVIVKVLANEGEGLRRAAHISISYLLLNDVLKDIREDEPVTLYIEDVNYTPNFIGSDQ